MSKKPTVLITGHSSGIGFGLTQEYLRRGWTVFGISRRGCSGLRGDIRDIKCDLAVFDAVGPALDKLLTRVEKLDLAVLNAGTLGEIRELHKTSIDEIKRVLDINLWANKAIMDWLHLSRILTNQIVFMSSGAAVKGSKGWGGYALSKAALNMMAQLYAHEFPDTHISAFAPGLVHTRMQDEIHNNVDGKQFPSAKILKDAYGTPLMLEPLDAGRILANAFEQLSHKPSGSFVDIRMLEINA